MEETSLELADVTVRRRNPVFAAAALTLLVPLPAIVVAVALVHGVLPLLALAPLTMFAGAALWAADPSPRERLSRLAAGRLGLFLDGRRVASREALREARLLPPHGDAPIVRIVAGRRAVELRVAGEDDGRRILRALDAEPRLPALRLGPRYLSDPSSAAQAALCAALFPFLCGAAGLCFGAHPVLFAALVTVAATSAAFVLATLLAPTRIFPGEHGVVIAWMGRRRALGYAEIDSVRLGEESFGAGERPARRVLSLALRSGELIRLAVDGETEGDAALAATKLEEALSPPRLVEGYRTLAQAP